MDEREFTKWILNNMDLIVKDNKDPLPKASSFGAISNNIENICDNEPKTCVKKFIHLETRIRSSPKYNIAACLIQKNMSTVLQAIMCFLYDEVRFLSNERSLTRESNNIRLCRKNNEFNNVDKAIKNSNNSWTLLAFSRHPTDRFLSNFIDRCIRKPTKGIYSCNNCKFNMTCFIIKEYEHMIHEQNAIVMRKDFEDMHFFPQNWRCDFHKKLNNYSIIKYKNKNEKELAEVIKSLNDLLYRQNIGNSSLDFIKKEMLKSKTMHTTIDSKVRTYLEDRLISSSFLMEYIVRMYYYDYKLFNYSIPLLNFAF
uniref:Uncharacterized protein n=1 Tax=Parastrongyloides trichosuri TaxID=131310 RepID=A0A0N5A163_PARTI